MPQHQAAPATAGHSAAHVRAADVGRKTTDPAVIATACCAGRGNPRPAGMPAIVTFRREYYSYVTKRPDKKKKEKA